MGKSVNGQATAPTTTRVSAMARPIQVSEQRTEAGVSRRAFELYEARGCEDGHDVENWLQAERELRVGRA